MEGNNYDLAIAIKRPDPFAEQRARAFRRLVVLASTIVLAYVVAGVTGYDLPSPIAVWDSLVSVAREIAHLPA